MLIMAAASKSTVVAHRLSVHFQNIIMPTKNPQKKYVEAINRHIALFREMLILLGQEKDCPELRIKIRACRCTLVQECQIAAQLLITPTLNNKSSCTTETLEDSNNFFILIYHLMRLFLWELNKCSRLIQSVPMDMEEYIESRGGTSNLTSVISEILLLRKHIKHDFIGEELASIGLNKKQILLILKDIEKFVPQETNGSHFEIHNLWPKKSGNKLFCCNYLS